MTNSASSFSFSAETLKQITVAVNELSEKYKRQIRISKFGDLTRIRPRNKPELACQGGKTSIVINEDGYVVPCHMMPRTAFDMYSFDEYISDIENGKTFVFQKAAERIQLKLEESGYSSTDLMCNGLCEFGGIS